MFNRLSIITTACLTILILGSCAKPSSTLAGGTNQPTATTTSSTSGSHHSAISTASSEALSAILACQKGYMQQFQIQKSRKSWLHNET